MNLEITSTRSLDDYTARAAILATNETDIQQPYP